MIPDQPIPPGYREPDRPVMTGDGKGMLVAAVVGQPRAPIASVLRPAAERASIPAGEAHIVGGLLAAAAVPTGDAIATRLEYIARDLLQMVEHTRLNPLEVREGLVPFTERVGQLLTEQSRLRVKSGAVPGPDVATEACRIVRSIARWSDGSALRARRHHFVTLLRTEIAKGERSIQNASESTHFAGSPIRREQEVKAHVTGLLEQKVRLENRLTALDAGGDGARVAILQPSITAAGGPKQAAARIAALFPSTSATGLMTDLNGQINDATNQLGLIDPESSRAAGLRTHLDQLQGQLRGARADDLAGRKKGAESLIRDAMAGDLDALTRLEPMAAAVGPDCEAAVNLARGSDADLVAVVGEIIAAFHSRLEATAAVRAAQKLMAAQ